MMQRLLEITLGVLLVFLLLWQWYPYLAYLLTLIFASICFFVLVVSLIAEGLERSKVPRLFYYAMAVGFAVPMILLGVQLALGWRLE